MENTNIDFKRAEFPIINEISVALENAPDFHAFLLVFSRYKDNFKDVKRHNAIDSLIVKSKDSIENIWNGYNQSKNSVARMSAVRALDRILQKIAEEIEKQFAND